MSAGDFIPEGFLSDPDLGFVGSWSQLSDQLQRGRPSDPIQNQENRVLLVLDWSHSLTVSVTNSFSVTER